jgi:cytochrome c553
MSSAAARLHPSLLTPLAEHYASLPGVAQSQPSTLPNAATQNDERVRRVVERGMPEANLPACARCHSPGKRADYPALFGQKREYLAARLLRWRGEPNIIEARKSNESMPVIARRIPAELIEPLAEYYAKHTARREQ